MNYVFWIDAFFANPISISDVHLWWSCKQEADFTVSNITNDFLLLIVQILYQNGHFFCLWWSRLPIVSHIGSFPYLFNMVNILETSSRLELYRPRLQAFIVLELTAWWIGRKTLYSIPFVCCPIKTLDVSVYETFTSIPRLRGSLFSLPIYVTYARFILSEEHVRYTQKTVYHGYN